VRARRRTGSPTDPRASASVIGEVPPSRVPDRNTTTGLDRQMRLALLGEPRLDNPVRLPEAVRRVAGASQFHRLPDLTRS
jgi:hypothetical protein